MTLLDDLSALDELAGFRRTPTYQEAPPLAREEILADYRIAYLSRQLSIIGRREVLSGNAKFGIFGGGKEIAQVALARAMRPGDWRAGYYRDQTLLLALGILTPQQLFAQLYGDSDPSADPASGGRAMVNHPASRLIAADGTWLPQRERANTSADISPTAGQMPRLVGLAYASRLYRELPDLAALSNFSQRGEEVAFGMIGNASCAEGLFWEAVNAIGVLHAPAVISIWDDGYGISVPNAAQITGGDLSPLLAGFQRSANNPHGYLVETVAGWDYPTLISVYARAAERARHEHIPALIHVTEMIQPQGHSTSGSHERYKSAERLEWEQLHDPLVIMRAWIIEHAIASEGQVSELEQAARHEVEASAEAARTHAEAPVRTEAQALATQFAQLALALPAEIGQQIAAQAAELRTAEHPLRRDLAVHLQRALIATRGQAAELRAGLRAAQAALRRDNAIRYGSHLYSQDQHSPLRVAPSAPRYPANPTAARGFEVLRANFDAWLARDPRIIMFGEDVGYLGDVNQGTSGLQERYGRMRVDDTGIREATIIGQAIGLAVRGLRPIAEIQYLDYILYALTTLSDDLACLHWRTAGGQKAPVIVRTRGHRLEGIWHSGSPIGALLGLLRGMHLLVPRDMTRAAGFYNTLLRGDDPALVIEVLNGYRLRETMPENLGDFCLPLGVPETLRAGDDVTLVTYGACCRIALEAAEHLAAVGIEVEVIDVQSLLPFDTEHAILASLKRTNRLLIVDEDMPGGASAFMLQQILEVQGGYWHLDSPPRTLSAQPHRPAYGSDGDYFSKPNAEDIFTAAYEMLHEADPARFPELG